MSQDNGATGPNSENVSTETHFERKLRERKAAAAASRPPVVQPFQVPEQDLVPVEVLGRTGMKSGYQIAVDEAVDSITLQEVYQKLSKNKYLYPRDRDKTTGDGILVSCPLPGHEDSNPSAAINPDKGKGGVGTCYACTAGFDKFIVAGLAYGIDPKADFNGLNKRMAEELRGVREPVATSAPVMVVEPDETPAPGPTGVTTHTGTPALEEPTDDVDEAEYPTYALSDVLPGTSTFLDLYCAEALKADVPREFPLWAGLAALSVAVGRKVALKKIETPTYSNLAICLTSGSASGKSRSVGLGVKTIRYAMPYEEFNLIQGDPTPGVNIQNLPGSGEALVESLDVKVPVPGPSGTVKHLSPVSLVKFEEMQTLVSKSAGRDSAYKAFIIDFTDCQPEISTRSKKNGHDKVENGFVTFITTTQPGHLRSQFTQRDKASGLLNRFLFPFGKAVPQRGWGVPDIDTGIAAVALRCINNWAAGLSPTDGDEYWIRESAWEDDARDEWVREWALRVQPDQTGPQSDLVGRMGLNMMRLTLLFAVNERSTVIKFTHVRAAFALYGYLRDCALVLAREVSATEMSDDMKAVMAVIEKVEKNKNRPAALKYMKDGSAAVKAMPQDKLLDVLYRLTRARQLFHVDLKHNSGPPAKCYTTDISQWEMHTTFKVTSAGA